MLLSGASIWEIRRLDNNSYKLTDDGFSTKLFKFVYNLEALHRDVMDKNSFISFILRNTT